MLSLITLSEKVILSVLSYHKPWACAGGEVRRGGGRAQGGGCDVGGPPPSFEMLTSRRLLAYPF